MGGKSKGPKGTRTRGRREKVVLATGVFDILHMGHLYYLTEARKLGDRLVVVVARDETARRLKRLPIVPEHLRLEMVRGLKPVDEAVLGDRDDFYKVVEMVKPHIIALGHDQSHDPEKISKELGGRGLDTRVVRLPCLRHDLMATRRIIEKILDAFGCAEADRKELEGLED
jgi:FAD synthetase